MIPLGDCSECGAPLAGDQRYCVDCGNKVAEGMPNPFALPLSAAAAPTVAVEQPSKKALLPIRPQMASVYAASALGFGVILGTGISPNLSAINAAATQIVSVPPASVPSASAPLASGGGGGGGGGGKVGTGSAPASSLYAGTSTSSSSSGGGGGGGNNNHHKQKKKKHKQVQTATGTVVHVNPIAGSYAIAPSSGGPLVAIHAATLQQPGTLIKVPIRILHNGTDAENGTVENLGTLSTASFTGTVTFVDAGAAVYTVSSRGTSVLVHLPATTPGAPAPVLPKLTDSVSVDVAIKPPPIPALGPSTNPQSGNPNCPTVDAALPPEAPATTPPAYLEQTAVTTASQVVGPTYVSGVVRATCANPQMLVVSADDTGESGRSIVLTPDPASSGIDFSKLHVGQPLEISATPPGPTNQADPYRLLGLISDETASGADDASTAQGQI